MFPLAIAIGIYSYLIFVLGILSLLYKQYILLISCLFFLSVIMVYRKNLQLPHIRKIKRGKLPLFHISLLSLLFLQILVNLIGALGPELAFDSLWYHLTLPKVYLLNHKIFSIPSGLFYYSDMPKLTEMLYIPAISLYSETLAKLIHFSFGILCLIALYKLARKFFHPKISLITLVIFYGSLVVGWESIAAYIDLSRTFFEIMALWAWIEWFETKKEMWLYMSAVLIGLAVTVKLLAIGSCAILLILTASILFREKSSWTHIVKYIVVYACISLLVPMPWFIFSSINTGNPVYPFFSAAYPIDHSLSLINPLTFFHDVWMIFTNAADPISPVFIAVLPLIIIHFSKMEKKINYIAWYALFAIIAWYSTPQTGGGRFILPYLPAFSLLSAWCIDYCKNEALQKMLLAFILIVSISSIGYRALANYKYIPVIAGKQSKSTFLTKHLNFSFGDFYDTDGYFAKNIRPNDRVLLINFHNLYYLDFPSTETLWLGKNKDFNYIAVQNAAIPAQYNTWKEIYKNITTGITLYKKR